MKCPECLSENPSGTRYCGACGTLLPRHDNHALVMTETLQAPVRELTTGSTFAGRYQVIEELGRGGMGRIYKVQVTKIGVKAALKLIRPEAGSDRQSLERFTNELKLARKIRHKNICQMFDLGEDAGTRYLTMEYVHGEDLKQIIRKMGRLSPGQAVAIALQVCDGLAEAHKLGVVHRDLKPQNIMLDEDGKARIMDFGIARSLSGKGITGAGVMIGTPEYMSPEQVEGKDVDPRSDLYSLGVILYEMVTGRVPFEGDSPFTIGVKHKSEAPKDPRTLNADVPEGLSRTILSCLEKEREKRCATAADLRTELDELGQGVLTAERAVPVRKTTTSREITVKLTLRKLLLPGLAVIAIVFAAIVFWPKETSPLDPNLVAVAVFENKTGDPKLDSIGSLAADRINQGLMTVGSFSVAPQPSGEELAGGQKGAARLQALAKATKAGKIIHGDYYLRGETVQFHVWVQDMAAGKTLLALEPVSGPGADPAPALETLRLRLMGGLASIFDPTISTWLGMMKEAPNIAAFNDFAQGSKLFSSAHYDKAVDLFIRAAESDPKLNLASILAFACYYVTAGTNYEKGEEIAIKIQSSKDSLSPAERALFDTLFALFRGDNEAALRSARTLSERWKISSAFFLNAHCADMANYPRESLECLAKIDPHDRVWKAWVTGNRPVSSSARHALGEYEEELREVLSLRKEYPGNLILLMGEVWPLAALGRIDDLKEAFEEGRSLSERFATNLMITAARELKAHGFEEESRRILVEALRLEESRPANEQAEYRDSRALLFFHLGRWTEAKDLAEILAKENPDQYFFLAIMGTASAHLGDRETALRASQQLAEDKSPPRELGRRTLARARIAAALGDRAGAMALIRKAVAEGSPYRDLHGIPEFDILWDYPPFIKFMKPKG